MLRIVPRKSHIKSTLRRRFSLGGVDSMANDSESAQLRTNLVWCVLAVLGRRALPNLDRPAAQIRKDPGTVLHLARGGIRSIARTPEHAS